MIYIYILFLFLILLSLPTLGVCCSLPLVIISYLKNIDKFILVLIPVSSAISPNLSLFMSLLYVVSNYSKIAFSWLLPVPILLFSWYLIDFNFRFDFLSYKVFFLDNNLKGLLEFKKDIEASPGVLYLGFIRIINISLLFCLFSIFCKSNRKEVLQYLKYGFFLALLVSISQLLFPQIFPNQTAYWTSINRLSGAFSDPNAYGVYLILFLPFIFNLRNNNTLINYILLFITILLGALSGSRTFFLGLFLYLTTYFLKGSYYKKIVLGIVAISFLLLINLYEFNLYFLPSGIQRFISAIQLSNLSETFYSRNVFALVNLEIIKDNLFLGTGFNHYLEFFERYRQIYAPEIGLWLDNPNSFYLGLLVEYGLLGIVLLYFVLRNLKIREDIDFKSLSPFFILLIILFFGNHLEFSEVSFLSAYIFSGVFIIKQKEDSLLFNLMKYVFYCFFLLLLVNKSFTYQRGLYSLEKDSNSFYAWSSRKGVLNLDCYKDKAKIKFEFPPLDYKVNKIYFSTRFEKKEIENISRLNETSFYCEGSKLKLFFKLDNTFYPNKFLKNKDYRKLGIKVFVN